jgi:BirA family biotin operon repressor/biotin-[acetyl-CoA-carboxylase] ligase
MTEPQVVHLASVASTQDVARELPIGSVVVADHQSAGRGRLDRSWQSPPGTALLASFVVAPHPVLSLACGVAAAEACGNGVKLKWPNDLLLDGRKVGGILVESRADKAVVGIGINLTAAPEGAAVLGVDRDRLLAVLRTTITTWSGTPTDAVLRRWRQLSDTLGRRVRVELPSGAFEGVAQDIDESGALIVDGTPVNAGDVIHLRA